MVCQLLARSLLAAITLRPACPAALLLLLPQSGKITRAEEARLKAQQAAAEKRQALQEASRIKAVSAWGWAGSWMGMV